MKLVKKETTRSLYALGDLIKPHEKSPELRISSANPGEGVSVSRSFMSDWLLSMQRE